MAENEDKNAEAKAKAADAKTKADEKVKAETEAKADAEAKAKAAEVADENEGLVKMHKGSEHLHVHPTTVEAHKSAGWKVA